MKLRDTYASTSDKAEDKVGKRIISDDAFAVCEFIEELKNIIRRII